MDFVYVESCFLSWFRLVDLQFHKIIKLWLFQQKP